jgi:ribonuclease BN (tRNA processing enzyme)
MTITAGHVEHTPPSFAFAIDGDGGRLVYSGDTSANGTLQALAADADLMLCEATLPERYAGAAPHLTATEAAAIARGAGVGRLVLVHIWSTNDRDEMARMASEAFGAPVIVATELQSFHVTPSGGVS